MSEPTHTPTGWQPIATAPTDGTPVLVRGRRTHIVNTATYRPDYHATRPWCDWDGNDPLPDEPTHWMPIPPAPPVSETLREMTPPPEADR